jgi:hypothetical protein
MNSENHSDSIEDVEVRIAESDPWASNSRARRGHG